MRSIEQDIQFNEGRVELDGRAFVNCTFQHVRLAYMGRDLIVLWNCSFPDIDSLEVELGDEPVKLIWDLGVSHRFGNRALAESVARFIEGSALSLPKAAESFSALPHLIPSLREITTAVPLATAAALRFIRGERQGVFREPVRLICPNPSCRQISIVPSMLPPGASRSVSQSNSMQCRRCLAFARVEDHWTDDTGRVFREFADHILRQPELPRAAIEQVEATAKDAGNKTARQAAQEIEAIDQRLAPLADEVRKTVDRRQFLRRMAILGVVAGAVLLGGSPAVELASAIGSADPQEVSSANSAHPSIQARSPTLDETVAALGRELEATCHAMLDAPEITALELREMLEACRLEARERQRLADERAASASGYAREFWNALRKPELGADAFASGLFGGMIALILGGISARLKSEPDK